MSFQSIRNPLQVIFLTCILAFSFSQSAKALTPKQQVAMASVSRIIANRNPASTLKSKQLLRQKKVLSRFLRKPAGPAKLRRDATIRLRQINAELRNRNNASENISKKPVLAPQMAAAKILSDRRPAARLSKQQLQRRFKALQGILIRRKVSRRLLDRARNMRDADLAELRKRQNKSATPQSFSVLDDRRPPASLANRQLSQRIRVLSEVVLVTASRPKLRKRARAMHAADVAELKRRRKITPQTGARNFAVLQDRRPAQRLNGVELRARVSVLRSALRRRDIARDIRRQLSRKLAADRTELRRRVAENRAQNAGRSYQPVVPDQRQEKLSEQARRLLSDRRPSNALSRRHLNTRIKSARNVLKFVPLAKHQRELLVNRIRDDRAEKRRRLLAARDRRRAKLHRQRSRGELRIEINPGFVPLPYNNGRRRGDIAAAEADEGQIQRQFLAPAPQNFERRYSRKEIVRRPDLTRRFAGIDVDTVNFGFNEYWIREEEVDELERMAVTIERILAARPYEVFQIEGHTDAVGSDAYNLNLSRQRAQAVKQALTEFFVIPAQALVTVGLGERYLKIPTPEAESENRRVTIRRITPIVRR